MILFAVVLSQYTRVTDRQTTSYDIRGSLQLIATFRWKLLSIAIYGRKKASDVFFIAIGFISDNSDECKFLYSWFNTIVDY